MIGDIMTISRLRMGTDGKGVSTLVTFFGCPLHCKYCINNFCNEDEKYFDGVPRGAYTPEELLHVLEQDDIYYQMSGGGITFGGGEPLLQSVFIHEVCKIAYPAWKMRVETSLNVPWQYVKPVIEDVDEWIIDIKDMDHEIYKKYTGVDIYSLIDNLFRLKECVEASKFHIRVPKIPGFNNEQKMAESVKWIQDLLKVEPEVFDYIRPAKINGTAGQYCR